MSSSTLFRLSGVFLIIGAVLVVAGDFLRPTDTFLNPLQTPTSLASFVGAMLVIVSLPGLYARLYKRIGIVGLIGFVCIIFSALMFGIGGGMLNLAVEPYLAQHAPSLLQGNGPPAFAIFFPVAGILQMLGVILFSIPILRAGTLPGVVRWAGVLMIIGGIVDFVGTFVGPDIVSNIGLAVYVAGIAWLGYFLITERQAVASQPEVVAAKA